MARLGILVMVTEPAEWPDPGVLPGQHEPWCDSQLGPEFEVHPGEVVMTIHTCLGCKPVPPNVPEPHPTTGR